MLRTETVKNTRHYYAPFGIPVGVRAGTIGPRAGAQSAEDCHLHTLGALPPLRSRPTGARLRRARGRPRGGAVVRASDLPLTRECLSLALAERAGVMEVAVARSPDQADAPAPSVIVLIHAGAEPIETGPRARGLPAPRAAPPEAPIGVLAARHSPADVLNALKMGVRGYLSQDISPQDLSRALNRISAGEVFAPAASLNDLPDGADDRGARRRCTPGHVR